MTHSASEERDGPQAPAVRVLVSNLSGVVQQVVTELIRQQPDMELVGEATGHLDTLLATSARVDVLILGHAALRPAPGLCSHLLGEYPTLKILVVTKQGDGAMLYWLGLRRQPVRPLSSRRLIDSIRRAHRLNPTVGR